MEEQSFQPGDLVVLKSGGPVMTVEEVLFGDTKVRCQWFAGKKMGLCARIRRGVQFTRLS